MQSITSDYFTDDGSPEPQLRLIADAGFSHVHWCHNWCTDHEYSSDEIDQILRWMSDFGLKTLNLHASDGKNKFWASTDEAIRQSGEKLVRNRIEMCARLGADVIIMHPPSGRGAANSTPAHYAQLRKSLDALMPVAKNAGVRIAVENMITEDFQMIRKVLADYSPDYVGLCYDSGHGNISKNGLDNLETLKDRLIALHMHDNDGAKDQHKNILTDTVDWARLAKLIAQSSYTGMINSEAVIHNTGIKEQPAFLQQALELGEKFGRMVQSHRA